MTRNDIGFALALSALALSGCAATQAIYLRNANGQTVRCGPYMDYSYLPITSMSTEEKVRYCMSYYTQNGFERVPAR